jgi:hypothetical protein
MYPEDANLIMATINERDRLKAEVERLRRIIGTLRTAFRVNMIRLKPEIAHQEIDELLDRIERETV